MAEPFLKYRTADKVQYRITHRGHKRLIRLLCPLLVLGNRQITHIIVIFVFLLTFKK